jgi:predicted HicB family RNase H-like nuclease
MSIQSRPSSRRPNGPQQGRQAKQMVVAVTREERDAYDTAAASEGITLSAWARRELSAAGGRPLRISVSSGARSDLRTSVGLRLSRDEWQAYRAEARRRGMSRNEWVRRVLNRAAGLPHVP